MEAAPVLSGKRFVQGRAQIAPEGEKQPFFPAGIVRGAVPSTTAPGHGQKPQPLLQHPSPHAFPSSSKATVFPRTAGKGERRRCSACTSLLANGNSGSGPHLGFPRLVQPSEKLAMVLLPFARGLDGDGSPGKGSASRCSRCHAASGSVPQRTASGYRGEPACSRQPPASGGRWRHSSHHFPISEQIYEPPKSSPAALQEGWGWGLAAGGGCLRGIVNLLSYTAAYHCATVIP